MVALCGVPLVAVMLPAPAGRFVRLKLAGVATPAVDAVTAKAPAVEFAVKVGAVAMPDELVTTAGEPPKTPLAPLEGAANVTIAPDTGLLPASFTVACSVP